MRLVLIEFNELSPVLLDRFIARGLLPNFKRFADASEVYLTDAGEDPPKLVPWIQWPTVHSGMPYQSHGVYHLGDGVTLREACLGELLSQAGFRVGIFGSMNCNYGALDGYVVPDPWTKEGRASPAWLQPFYETTSRSVKASVANAISKADLVRLATFWLTHGMTPATFAQTLRQVWEDRRDRGLTWREASILDSISYDVFAYCNKRLQIDFATFFSNSTAHYQHFYWRNMEPESFDEPPSATDHPSLDDAILFGYQRMDALLARFFHDYAGATLVLATALSQVAYNGPTGRTFRPRNFDAFLRFAGIGPAVVSPVMSTQFQIDFPSERAADDAERKLRAMTIEGAPILDVRRNAPSSIFTGCKLFDEDVLEATLQAHDGTRQRFGAIFDLREGRRSGHHHRRGVLWIHAGSHRVHDDVVHLEDIAPTILGQFGVAAPPRMQGRNLLSREAVPA